MWAEIGKTIRAAIDDWDKTYRLLLCITVGSIAAVAIIWASTH